MTNRRFSTLALTCLAALPVAITSLPTPALARGDEHDHGHSHDYEYTEPTSYAAAIRLLDELMGHIAIDVPAGGEPDTHNIIDAVERTAKLLGRLAVKPGSGVERAKVRDINLKGKEIAQIAHDLHVAADSNDWKGAQTHFDRLSAFYTDLLALAPIQYAVEVKPAGTVAPGAPVTLNIAMKDPSGQPVKDLAIVHDKPLHFLVVSSDLSWYLHDHPTRNPDGTFTTNITFPHAGDFRLFSDFTPAAEGAGNQVVQSSLAVPGSAPARVPLKVDALELIDIGDGYSARLRCNADDYIPGHDTLLRFTVQRDNAPLADLEPYLGAMGHLVIFSEDLKHFVHAHPLSAEDLNMLKPGAEKKPAADSKPKDTHSHGGHDHAHHLSAGMKHPDDYADGHKADIAFHVNFPAPGHYKMFAQFQHKSKVLTVPWTVRVYDAPKTDHAEHEKDKK